MKRVIKILTCSDPLMWYADKIGLECVYLGETETEYITREDSGLVNIVKKTDGCKEWKFELPENATAQLNDLNNKVNELYGYNSNDINFNICQLQKSGEIKVGYRASCGTTDRTQKAFRLWLKAVKILTKNGLKINDEAIKVNNSYATLSGGFWHEIRYFIA